MFIKIRAVDFALRVFYFNEEKYLLFPTADGAEC